MEISFKEILESEAYEWQKQQLANEINWGDPQDEYIPKKNVFEHTVAELPLLRKFRKQWREKMRDKWGPTWSKRNASHPWGEFNNRMN